MSTADEPDVLIPHTVSRDRANDLVDVLSDAIGGDLLVAEFPAASRELIAGAEVVLAGSLPDGLLSAAGDLGWIHALSSGVDHYDREALADRGILLTNSAGIHAEPIAEQVLWYMLTFERRLHVGVEQQAESVWERFEGGELRGKTLGIVGVGSIGSRVAEYGSALGMDVVGTKRDTSTVPAGVDDLLPADSYHELLGRADYVVLTCPLTDRTRGMFGMAEFRQMGSGTVLVNVARGGICDQDALATALQYHVIAGAGLDTFEEEPLPEGSPLWDLSNVLVTPHMAGSTPHKPDRWRELIRHNYGAYAAGDYDGMRNRVV